MPEPQQQAQQQQQLTRTTPEGRQLSHFQIAENDSLELNGQLLAWLLHWWVLLMVAWRVSCYAAGPMRPMFLFAA
jgi:hypothetical protein